MEAFKLNCAPTPLLHRQQIHSAPYVPTRDRAGHAVLIRSRNQAVGVRRNLTIIFHWKMDEKKKGGWITVDGDPTEKVGEALPKPKGMSVSFSLSPSKKRRVGRASGAGSVSAPPQQRRPYSESGGGGGGSAAAVADADRLLGGAAGAGAPAALGQATQQRKQKR